MAVELIILPKPILSVSLLPGGDLTVGETYFFAGYYSEGKNSQYGQYCSPPNDGEVSITTDAMNRTIRLSWKYENDLGGFIDGLPPNADGIQFKWDTKTLLLPSGEHNPWGDDVSYGHRKWTHRYYDSVYWTGNYKDIQLADLKTGTGYQSRGKYCSPNFAWGTGFGLLSGLSTTKGKIGIKITGTDTSTTFKKTIINALQAEPKAEGLYLVNNSNYYKTNYDHLMLLGNIIGDGSGTLYKLDITYLAGANFDSNITFDNCFLSCYDEYIRFRPYGIYKDCAIRTASNNDIDYMNVDESYNLFLSSGNITAYNSGRNRTLTQVSIAHFPYPVPTDVQDNYTYQHTPCYITVGTELPYIAEMNYTNFKFYNNDKLDHDLSINTISTSRLLDLNKTFNITNVYSDRDDGKILVKFENKALYTGNIEFNINVKDTINFSVVDKNDNKIENAIIKIIDNYTTEYSTTSDINGEGELTILNYICEYDDTNTNGLYSKHALKSPFTLTIEKTGYLPYVETFDTIDTTKSIALTTLNLPTISFTANDTSLDYGDSALLSWEVTNADSISINEGIGSVSATDSLSVTPLDTITYILTAENEYGTVTEDIKITVNPNLPIINTFSVDSSSILYGENVTLTWNVTNANTITINEGIGSVSDSDSTDLSLADTTTFIITATNDSGTVTDSVKVIVNDNLPIINTFHADDYTIEHGGTVTIIWEVTNANTININEGIGIVDATGSRTLKLSDTTTFILTATNDSGTVFNYIKILTDPEIVTEYISRGKVKPKNISISSIKVSSKISKL